MIIIINKFNIIICCFRMQINIFLIFFKKIFIIKIFYFFYELRLLGYDIFLNNYFIKQLFAIILWTFFLVNY